MIVACTGWGDEDVRQRSKAAGFDFHMVKPIDPAELERVLSSCPKMAAAEPPRWNALCLSLGQETDRKAVVPKHRSAFMRKPSSSSKNVIAALVAAAFGLTAGPALAQTTSHGDQSHTPASHRPASKKSVRHLTSQVKHEREQMQATTAKLNRATAQLKRTTHRLKQTQAKELRVASAEHNVRKGTHKAQRSRMHPRHVHHASTTPPRQ